MRIEGHTRALPPADDDRRGPKKVDEPPAETPSVAAHRGLAHLPDGKDGAPRPKDAGNNLKDMRAAIAAGADELEVDVRRTRDGVLVLYHDGEIASGKHKGKKVRDVDHEDLGRLSNGAKVPTLDEAIALAKSAGVKLQVEVKDKADDPRGKETAERVARKLLSSLPADRFLVTSFDPAQIRAVEGVAGGKVRTSLWITKNVQTKTRNVIDGSLRTESGRPTDLRDIFFASRLEGARPNADWTIRQAKEARADGVSVGSYGATPDLLDEAGKAGLDVYVGGVNTPGKMKKLATDPRIAGIVTEEPGAAKSKQSE
jgi:glycerophosphoryl diester phosphodiesterase